MRFEQFRLTTPPPRVVHPHDWIVGGRMRQRKWDSLGAMLVSAAIIAALALVVNPEFRALLVLTDTLGVELVALLLATQLKVQGYALLPAVNAIINALCALAFRVGRGAARVYPDALPWRPFDKLLCPALVVATYGIRCRFVNHPSTPMQ